MRGRAARVMRALSELNRLANFVLDELDRELKRRGHRCVRYAEDSNICVRSERAGQPVMESLQRFITRELKLRANETKSTAAPPRERKYLGFSFSAGPDVKRVIAPKALDGLTHAGPGDHATGQRRQYENHDRGIGSIYAGLARLLRILRNARGADRSHSLGPAAAQSGHVAAVENTAPWPGCAVGTEGARRLPLCRSICLRLAVSAHTEV
jgi:hypothetical protein